MMVNNSHTHSLNVAHFQMVQRISASMNLCEFSAPDRVWDNSMASNSKTTGVVFSTHFFTAPVYPSRATPHYLWRILGTARKYQA